MSDLKKLLSTANVTRAVIVDDAYDDVPCALDLSLDEDSWSQFFDDLTEEDRTQLRTVFPRYDEMRADQLRSDDAFVASIWNDRSKLRNAVIGPLFERYTRDKGQDLNYLQTLKGSLESLGIACETAGRAFEMKAADADLIVIDLYLGSAQDDEAIKTSIQGLKNVIHGRPTKPPLVVLMSRSSRLEEKRKEFRDQCELFESAFRIIRKAELAEPGKLSRLLSRLAGHYSDSLKLAVFLNAWRTGLSEAGTRTADLIRSLDLADHAQIQQLLLAEEGEAQGSYLVDVFDRVLQHEIEREGQTIDAAIGLNGLNSDMYPPPYVAGSRDLQSFVFRSMFQNTERLRLIQAEGSRVAFGDILRRKEQGVEASTERLSDIGRDKVLAVMTPACDLQRKGAKGILMLIGELLRLDPSNWSYADSPIRTPIIEMPGGERCWIKWNLKHIETIGHTDLETLLDRPQGFSVVARLREAHALELQQKLLSSLGRVGLLAPMPGTFPIKVEIYLPGLDKKLFRVNVPGLATECGVCFVGRQGVSDMRLILCEDDCEAIYKAVGSVNLDSIHADVRELVKSLSGTDELLSAMEKGLVLPSPQSQGFKEIVAKSVSATGEPTELTIGLICRGKSLDGKDVTPLRKAGIVLAVADKIPP